MLRSLKIFFYKGLMVMLKLVGRLLPQARPTTAGTGSEVTIDPGEDALSQRFIDKVKQLCKELNIPEKVEPLNKADIGSIARDALKEAHYLYPVPKYMDQR